MSIKVSQYCLMSESLSAKKLVWTNSTTILDRETLYQMNSSEIKKSQLTLPYTSIPRKVILVVHTKARSKDQNPETQHNETNPFIIPTRSYLPSPIKNSNQTKDSPFPRKIPQTFYTHFFLYPNVHTIDLYADKTSLIFKNQQFQYSIFNIQPSSNLKSTGLNLSLIFSILH